MVLVLLMWVSCLIWIVISELSIVVVMVIRLFVVKLVVLGCMIISILMKLIMIVV